MSAIRDGVLLLLRREGLNALASAERAGICDAPYLTVHDGGAAARGRGLSRRTVVVTAYAPLGDGAALGEVLRRAKAALSKVEGLRPDGGEGEEFVLEGYRAVAVELKFTALCGE